MRFLLSLFLLLFTLKSYAFTLSGNFSDGWSPSKLTFYFNLTNCPTEVVGAFNDAADLWNSVSTSRMELAAGPTTSAATPGQVFASTATDIPVIVCDNNFGATTSKDQNVVAGTGIAGITGGGGSLNNGGLILNTSAGAASLNGKSKLQISIILAHELGHVLGFGHSSDKAALMYYDASAKKALRLSQDDWDAMTYLYPRDEFGDDKLMGCGLLSNNGSNTSAHTLIILLMLMPLLLLLKLRGSYNQNRIFRNT